jgi:hypothetical protein
MWLRVEGYKMRFSFLLLFSSQSKKRNGQPELYESFYIDIMVQRPLKQGFISTANEA